MHPAEKYIKEVLSGKQVTGEYIKLACKRHVADLKRKDIYFDHKAAQKVIDFVQICRHHIGELAGQRIVLEPWQQFYFWLAYGWKRKDGTRRFTETYTEVARKNGKTILKATEALYAIYLDSEPGAQVYCGATKEDQALILVNDAGAIMRKTPELNKLLKEGKSKLFENQGKIRRVVNYENGSFIAPLGRDSNTQDGFNPHMGIMDERHAHKTNDVANVIQSGMGSRRQPMLSSITTAGFNKSFPAYSLRKTGIDILKGVKENDAFLCLIYCLDKKDNWEDPKTWIKANPNLEVSVKLKFLKDQYQKAKTEGGDAEVNFKTKNLNEWTDSAQTWLQDDVWMKCEGETDPESDPFGALDLASTRDITAFSLLFPDKKKKIKTFYWIPEDSIAERVKQGVPYDRWVEEGWIKTTPGNVTDYDFIKRDILEIKKKHNFISAAFDRWNASQLVIQLQDEGIVMTPFGQGFSSMSAPTKEFEKMVLSGEVEHDGNPVTRWMMGNILIQRDPAGNIKIDKGKSVEKVDGPVSIVMSIGEWMTNKEVSTPTIQIW